MELISTPAENMEVLYARHAGNFSIAECRELKEVIEILRGISGEAKQVAWLLTDQSINSLQVDSVQRLISRAWAAHHVDLIIRINGKDEHHEADWLKHLVRAHTPEAPNT